MRRIDKSRILSTRYKEWVDKLDRDCVPHPHREKYDNREKCDIYYLDVVMNLLYCQGGVCAYTEMRLCRPGHIAEELWKNGRYKKKKPHKIGSLDHFDPDEKKDKFWKWENLFVMHDHLNSYKSNKKVKDERFKPDLPGYDPFKLLDYDPDRNCFYPHPDIEDEAERQRIWDTLDVLQINNGFVRYERETFFEKIFVDDKVNHSFEPDRFFTAFEMWRTKMRNQRTGEVKDEPGFGTY